MKKCTAIVTSALCLFASLAMVACQGKNETNETKMLTYQFEENGCNTGKKEFSTKEAYCAALTDDSANNFCASNLRQQDFERQCKTQSKPQPQENADQELPSIPQPDLDSNMPTEPDVQTTRQLAPQTSEESAIEELVVTANANRSLRIKTTATEDEIITTLGDELPVTEMSADIQGKLNLAMAEATFKPDIAPCKLFTKNFDSTSGNKAIAFTLMSIDKKSDGLSECLKRLNQFAFEGFTVEFDNVRLGGPLSQKQIKKLTIQVRP